MTFGETWDRLHAEHGLRAVSGVGATPEAMLESGRAQADYLAARVPPGARVLDYGCGPGRVARHLAPKVGELVGADASGAILEQFRANVPGARAAQAERPRDVPRGTGFDVVYMLAVVYHLSDIQAYSVMDDCRGLLRPNGLLVFDFCDIRHARYARMFTQKRQAMSWVTPWPWCLHHPEAIREVAEQLGYATELDFGPDPSHPIALARLRCG